MLFWVKQLTLLYQNSVDEYGSKLTITSSSLKGCTASEN